MNDRIKKMISEYYEDGDFVGPQSLSRIQRVEKENNLKFPEQYKEYISYFGSGGICGVAIKGIESENSASVIHSSKKAWANGLDRQFIVIYDIGEVVFCMDANNSILESPVYSWEPFNKKAVRQDYSNFDAFVEDYFQEGIDNW